MELLIISSCGFKPLVAPNSRTTWPNWANHLDSLHWVEGLVKLYKLSRAIAAGPTCLIWNWIAYHRFSFLPVFGFPIPTSEIVEINVVIVLRSQRLSWISISAMLNSRKHISKIKHIHTLLKGYSDQAQNDFTLKYRYIMESHMYVSYEGT